MAISDDFSPMTQVAIQAALQAGKILIQGFGTTYQITAKPGRQNFVTEYDKASEASIISFIREHYPSHGFLAEESGFNSPPHQKDNILWIIDPLDGTTNFAHHIPLFTISIAAYHKNQGLCGVVYQPLTQELFIAEKGKGAFLHTNRLRVSQTKQIEEALIIASFPHDRSSSPKFHPEKLTHIVQQGGVLRNFGSAALALAYVAAGKVDAFWMYNLHPWDLAAGKLLIEEAGGEWSCDGSSSSSFDAPTNILASNQALHTFLQNLLIS